MTWFIDSLVEAMLRTILRYQLIDVNIIYASNHDITNTEEIFLNFDDFLKLIINLKQIL